MSGSKGENAERDNAHLLTVYYALILEHVNSTPQDSLEEVIRSRVEVPAHLELEANSFALHVPFYRGRRRCGNYAQGNLRGDVVVELVEETVHVRCLGAPVVRIVAMCIVVVSNGVFAEQSRGGAVGLSMSQIIYTRAVYVKCTIAARRIYRHNP